MLKKIRRMIPEQVQIKVKLLFVSSNQKKWTEAIKSDRKNIFVFLCGFYQNLGDMALTYSQMLFLKKEYPQANIILIPSTETYSAVKTIKKYIQKEDLITILGGGNMDDIYVSLDSARLHVVKTFRHHRIVCFPQTYAFSNSVFGKRREAVSRKVYERHKLITIFVREQFSMRRIRKSLPNTDIGYCPDIVLSLKLPDQKAIRDKMLLCFRKDKEQRSTDGFAEKLLMEAREQFDDVIVRDTVDVTLKECQPDTYEQTLRSFWTMLQTCKVVITDRLHCMIFCVINRTPCIALDNTNRKVSGVYQAWLQKIPYIRIMNDREAPASIVSAARELAATDQSAFDYDFSDEFEPLRTAVHRKGPIEK